jgi:hypothetical protein
MRLLPEEERLETLAILERNRKDVEKALQVGSSRLLHCRLLVITVWYAAHHEAGSISWQVTTSMAADPMPWSTCLQSFQAAQCFVCPVGWVCCHQVLS